MSGLGIAGSAFSVTRGYEPNRNLPTSLDAKWNTTSRTRYDYTNNALGQHATAKQSGDVFGDFGGSTYYRYIYNARGEVVEAVDYLGEDPASITSPQLAGRRFGYAYDPIGNRQSATRALGTSVSDAFSANALNQYTSRENDVAYVAGTAAAASTVAVTGGTATSGVGRAGRYWGAQVTLNNTSGPAKANLTVTASLTSPNVTRTESRTAFLPPALQSFGYDDDGNLTGDGVWNYAYDAENRLITMTTTVAAVNAGYPNRQLEFKYDYAGRRVQKRSVNFTAGTDVYTRHLYDGNNLVAEFAATSTSCGALLLSYTWGLDLAGSLTATGGVGALVQISDHQSATACFPTYDGNGNVASLLRASDGAAAAKYEYSPFGELLRCEGTYAKENPFRFSTKFTDDESGLIYYGARYYNPSLGRFINRDPIAEQGGLNLYGFCANDGVNHTDYLGYSWLSKTLKKLERWTRKHTIGAILLNVATSIVAPWATPLTASLSLASQAHRTWDVAKKNPQAAAIVAAIATWYIGGWGAAAIGITNATAAGAFAGAASGFAGGFVGARASGASISDSFSFGLRGAAGGAIMGGIAGYYGNNFTLPRVGVTAVGGGVASEIQGGSFRRGFEISGALAFTTWAAVKAREYMWEQSNKYVDKNGVRVNATGDSVGYKGIGGKVGGVRATVTGYDANGNPILSFPEGPLGGSQGGPGQTFGWRYAVGSIRDRVVEAYSGVHDFLNWPFSYNAMGNNEAAVAPWGRYIAAVGGAKAANFVSGAMSWVNVPVATPIVVASAIPEIAYPFLTSPTAND